MFLFILESIGTSELILIGIIALIFLGPRKLPQIAKTMGKMMAEFRNTTNEFKETWQREVDFEDEIKAIRNVDEDESSLAPVPRIDAQRDSTSTIAAPEIKPAQAELFTLPAEPVEQEKEQVAAPTEDQLSDKRNWL
jgi:sec-independent protein translocase protein TatB